MLALGLAVLSLTGLRLGIGSIVRRRVDRLAPIELRQKNYGVLIQRAMVEAPGVLPIYGSSQLTRQSRFRAAEFFAHRPTGFQVSPVGERGTALLVTAQQLGALAGKLTGRKVVVLVDLLTYKVFENAKSKRALAVYAGTWSSLQAGRTLYNDHLTYSLRQRLARRMGTYPEVLGAHPLLAFTVARLSGESRLDRLGYMAAVPFGRLELVVLDWFDAAHVLLDFIRRPALRRPSLAQPAALDWTALGDSATRIYAPEAGHNPAGARDRFWSKFHQLYERRRAEVSEAQTLEEMVSSSNWADLDLVLQVLREAQADALLLGIPVPGQFFHYLGLSDAVPRAYYDSLTAHARRAGVRVVILDSLTNVPDIITDMEHPTPTGWVHLDRTLDAFYHDSLQ